MWWLVAILLVLLVYKYLIKPHQHWKRVNIPHVKPWPLFGNMAPFVFRQKSMAEWVQDIYNSHDDQNRYIGLYTFVTPILMIKNINLIKQISVKDFEHFPDRRNIVSEETDPLFGKNLSSLTGQKWKHMRSTLSPAFTGTKMRVMFVLMSECADQFVDYFSKQVGDSKKPITIEMKDILSRFATDVIATTAFGLKCDSLNEKNNEFYLMGSNAINFARSRNFRFFLYTISPRLVKLFNIKLLSDEICNFFRNIVASTIKTRQEQNIFRPDMIHLLMEARKGNLKHEETSKKSDDNNAGFATVEESHGREEFKQALMGKCISNIHLYSV